MTCVRPARAARARIGPAASYQQSRVSRSPRRAHARSAPERRRRSRRGPVFHDGEQFLRADVAVVCLLDDHVGGEQRAQLYLCFEPLLRQWRVQDRECGTAGTRRPVSSRTSLGCRCHRERRTPRLRARQSSPRLRRRTLRRPVRQEYRRYRTRLLLQPSVLCPTLRRRGGTPHRSGTAADRSRRRVRTLPRHRFRPSPRRSSVAPSADRVPRQGRWSRSAGNPAS